VTYAHAELEDVTHRESSTCSTCGVGSDTFNHFQPRKFDDIRVVDLDKDYLKSEMAEGHRARAARNAGPLPTQY
jgi:hypothetical protein